MRSLKPLPFLFLALLALAAVPAAAQGNAPAPAPALTTAAQPGGCAPAAPEAGTAAATDDAAPACAPDDPLVAAGLFVEPIEQMGPPIKKRYCRCGCGATCSTDADCGPGGSCVAFVTCC